MRWGLDGRVIQDHFPGLGRYAFNLARALAIAAPQDELILLYDPAARNARYPLAALGELANVRLVPATAPLFALREQWRLPRQLAPLGLDAFHAPYLFHPYFLPVPSVFTAYDLIPLRYPAYYRVRERLIFRVALECSLRTAQRTIVISHTTAEDLQRLCGARPERLAIIPLAADPAFAPQPPEAIAAVRYRYGLPQAYALYVGSNKPHKNLVRLVESWSLVAARQAGAVLVVAGHWEPRYPQAQERATALKLGANVRFLGAVQEADLPALYAGARLFLFPSLWEGFGLPVLEAMSCGVPVICSRAASLPEVAGEAAILLAPEDPVAWAQAILALWEDAGARAEWARRGLARARQFSWARTAEETLAIYRQVAQRTPPEV